MKKLYYSLIILLVVFVGLVLPKTKAAGGFDYSASHIGYIDSLQTNSTGDIVGAYVYITDSSQSDIMYDVGYYFNLQYFQSDITSYGYDLIGKILIWNLFDNRGASQVGAWWLLIDYQQMLEDFVDKYYEGYYEGLSEGYYEGMNDGTYEGYEAGLEDGYDIGYEDGEQLGYANGYGVGYDDGYSDGREQVLNSIGEIGEILFQDIVLPNGVKDEIVNNEILVDRVGFAVFDGTESWSRYGSQETSEWQTIAFRTFEPLIENSGVTDLQTTTAISSYFLQRRGQQDNLNEDWECFFITSAGYLYVRIFKSRLAGFDEGWTNDQKVDAFNSWLAEQKTAENPFTVWYQYAESEQYDLISLLRNEDGSFKDGYNKGYTNGRVDVQKENKSLLSVIPTTIGAVWLMISDFLSYEVFGLNLWAILMMFAGFSLLILIIRMVI